MAYLLVAAATFGVMFLLDKGLTKLFRSREQHASGTAVRLKKRYGVFSVALMLLGVLALMTFFTEHSAILLVGGILLIPGGAVLGIYYLTHGIFYDSDSFLYTTFGNRSVSFRYSDIQGQRLYRLQGGSHLVELYMTDGETVPVQTDMEGALSFLDKAAHARMRQKGLNSHECQWFDEQNSCWFPPMED
ncbi:MAG: hypothetical protein IKD27_06310 [Oscillospiraceae bacterium]|nr:hypothetical protein [Oscillospiraceae bacterium]